MERYSHYMQKFGTDDDLSVPVMDLEADFPGLVYIEAKGLSAKGAPKNVYFEEYAESDEVRAFLPETVCREATEVTLTFGFGGDARRDTYDSFYDYVKSGKVKYWDTARHRLVHLVLNDGVDPSDDVLKGGQPYIIADFKFMNLSGQSYRCDDSGNMDSGGTEDGNQ